MLRSVESMTTRELIFLLRKFFILGFALGSIGLICFFLLAAGNDDPLGSGAVAAGTLLLALFLNMLNGRIVTELSRRLGML
jgi:hypothetical protein